MIVPARLRGSLALGLMSLLGACVPGPRLQASWYLVYEPAPVEPYRWIDPTQSAPPAPQPPRVESEPAGEIYVSIRNLGRRVVLSRVLLSADDLPLQRSDHIGNPYILGPGEIMVLPLKRSAQDSSRDCIIPTLLTVEAISPRRRTRTLKVAGGLPASLPQEWIETCNGRRPHIP